MFANLGIEGRTSRPIPNGLVCLWTHDVAIDSMQRARMIECSMTIE